MPKLLMLKGLPASGKSTRARELVDSGNYTRVNRDDLRAMMHNGKWTPLNEDIVVDAEQKVAAFALLGGRNVVVDDTNLNPRNEKMWRELADAVGATFEVEEIKTPFEECVRRDALRNEKRVGRDVIVGMALQWNLFPHPDKGIVLCDLDGTLCDLSHRLKYAKDGPDKSWAKFFEGIPGDKLRGDTLKILTDARSRGHKVFFVSARPDTYRDVTIEWLTKHLPVDFVYEGLIMRRGNDKREDSIVKQQMYDTYFKHYPVEFVVDDRPRVINMWRENGLHVIDVGPGVDF